MAKKMTAAQKLFLADRVEYQNDRIAQYENAESIFVLLFEAKPTVSQALRTLDLMDQSVNEDGEFDEKDFLEQIKLTKAGFAGANADEILELHGELMILPEDDDDDADGEEEEEEKTEEEGE